MTALTGLDAAQFLAVADRLRPPPSPPRGRPWALPFHRRIEIACTSLRTNLTVRELAAVYAISRSMAHRIVVDMTARLASRLPATVEADRRRSWIVDGTLVPTRDHRHAAKSKNYRYSCNAQILVRRTDLHVIAAFVGGPGNRNDPVHYRGSEIERLCKLHGRVLADGGYRGLPELITPVFHKRHILRNARWRRHRKRRARVEHAIARLKDWRILRDYRRRGHELQRSLHAVAFLHNIRLKFRDSS